MGTKRRIEGENRILQWLVKERGRRVQESGVEMEMDEGWNKNRMREDDMKGMNGKNDERMNEKGVEQ